MKKLILALGILLCSAMPAFANTCVYTGAGDANASTTTNWSGCGGVAPTTGDTVIFDGAFPVTGNDNCTWNIAADFASFVTTGYSGLITASATITVSGTVTLANSTFAHGNQNFILDATATINPGTAGNTFYDFDFTDGITATLANNLTVTHNLILVNAVATTTFSGSAAIKKIFVGGNVTATSGRATGTSSTDYVSIELNGTGAQTYTGNTDYTNVPGVLIFNKSSGTATIAGGLIPYAGITHTLGTTDFTTNTVTTYLKDTAVNQTITSNGSITFYNYTLGDNSTLTLGDNMTIANTLDIGGESVGTSTINGNTILLSGNFINTAGNQVNGTFNLTFTGSGAQTWSATNTTYIIGGGTMTVNKSGSALTVSGSVRWDGSFAYTAGTVTTTSSTVNWVGSKNHNSGSIVWNNWSTFSSGTITLTGNLNAANVTIPTGTTLSAGSNTITVSGNFTKVGTFTAGTSTVTFSGSTTHTIDGTATFYNFTCPTGETCSFDDADVFTVSGTCAGNGAYVSDDGANTVDVDCTTETITSSNCTRVDSATGNPITSSGTLTACVNWAAASTRKLIMVAS